MAKKRAKKTTKGKPGSKRKKTPKAETVEWISEEAAEQAGIDEGSKLVKKLAAQQKIAVKLTTEQMEAIRSQLKKWDNKRPAEITFVVKGEPRAKFRVAAYAYRRRTCCA